ncbi:hypothetical protein MTO96_044917 [Rhipicephalus appendiculatus]
MGIFVNLKKIKALKSVYVSGMVRKADLKLWLNYLCSSPLYMRYHISVPEGAIDQCLNDLANADEMETAEGLEDGAAAIDDPVCASRLLTLRQETVIWDDKKLKQPVEKRRRKVEDMLSLYEASLVNNDPVVYALLFDKLHLRRI